MKWKKFFSAYSDLLIIIFLFAAIIAGVRYIHEILISIFGL